MNRLPSAPLNKKVLIAINASNLALLAAGFVSTLLVPRLAIKAIGVEEYGLFALLLGYCLIPTMMDLGVTPGLTRELGVLVAEKKFPQANFMLGRIRNWLGVGAFVMAGGVALVAALSTKGGKGVIWPVLFGASANAAMLASDITLLKLRISSRIVQANLIKCIYYGTYVGSVGAFALTHHLGLTALFGSQFIGAVTYGIATVARTRNAWRGHEGASTPMSIPWKRLLRAALPEQMNRAKFSLLPGAERSLMFALAGGTFVGAYDVALRMSALVTAAPSALSDPLVALLSSRQHEAYRAERRMILRHSIELGLLTLLVAIAATAMIVKYFAIDYYHMRGTAFVPIICFVVFGSAVNVLTAPAVAYFYSIGRPGPVIAKTSGDVSFALVGLGLGWWSRSPLIYIAVRYIGYLLTAIGLVSFSLFVFRQSIGAATNDKTADP